METTINTTMTNETVKVWKKGCNGHYIPHLIFRDEDYNEIYEVAKIEDARYYAYFELPEDMMIDETFEEGNYKLERMSCPIEGGKQYGTYEETPHGTQISVTTIYVDGTSDYYTARWMVTK